MSHILLQLGQGFIDCLTPINMLMLFIGIVLGLLIGVLPGLTLVMGVRSRCPSPTGWTSLLRSFSCRRCMSPAPMVALSRRYYFEYPANL